MDFKKTFKPPFKAYDDCFIWTADGVMAFDFTPCGFEISEGFKNEIIDALNGKGSNFPGHWENWDGKFVFFHDLNKSMGYGIMRVRGWGYLTGTGGLNLPPDEAAKIQDEFTEWALNKLNNNVKSL